MTISAIGRCLCEEKGIGKPKHWDKCPVHGSVLVGRVSSYEVAHHCTFQGWEDVEGQCDFPWAKHEARTFKPEFHRISRKGEES